MNTIKEPIDPDALHASGAYGPRKCRRTVLAEGLELERLDDWAAGEVTLPALTHHRVTVNGMLGTRWSRWKVDGEEFASIIARSFVMAAAAGKDVEAAWDKRFRGVFHYLIRPDVLNRLAAEVGASGEVEVVSGFHGLDGWLWEATSRLDYELNHTGYGEQLMRDALIIQIQVHLLRTYTNLGDARGSVQLSRRDRLRENAVRASLEFMREHLGRGIALEDLASVAGVSRFHFCRLFRQTLGCTPMEKLMKMRVEHARVMIAKEGRMKSLAAIAGDCGFSDQSHLGRHFKRTYGQTPGEFLGDCHRALARSANGLS